MHKKTAHQLIQETQTSYDRIAEHFHQTRSRLWPIVRYCVEQTVKPGDCVLDSGCGNGRLLPAIEEFGGKYVGLDLSMQLLDQAQQQYPTGTFIHSSMTQLPFSSGSFDVVMMIASFQHIPSHALRLQTLQEARRVLKTGGHLVLVNWNLQQTRFRKQRAWSRFKILTGQSKLGWNDLLIPWKNSDGQVQAMRYYHGYTASELRQLAKETDWNILELWYELHGVASLPETAANTITIWQK